jgi:nitrate/TMAO reductase-like tetraheme cytochrome c subunit
MGEESQEPRTTGPSQKHWKKALAFISSWTGAALLATILLLVAAGGFLTHGTIEAVGFCGTCHTAYYDAKEYAFNDRVGMSKPSGILTGCAECHAQPYAEFKKSAHSMTSKTDRRPGCVNCHKDTHSVLTWYMFMYRQPVAWKKVQLSLHDRGLWEKEVRPDLAAKARAEFVQSDSATCRGCHNNAAKTWRENIRVHQTALKTGKTCIKCHFNLVHAEVPWPDKDKK